MADIFQEVEEAVRHEQYMKLWKRYRFLVIGAALALVLGVAGYEGWTYWQEQRRAENSQSFAAALAAAEEAGPAEAISALQEVADSDPDGYGLLARFRIAAQHLEAGDREAAAGELDALAADTSAPKALRDLALLQSVLLRLDEGDPAELEGRLAPLLAEANPYYPSATEVMAYIALKKGDEEKARELLQRLLDDGDTPGGLRSRAQQMLAVIGAE